MRRAARCARPPALRGIREEPAPCAIGTNRPHAFNARSNQQNTSTRTAAVVPLNDTISLNETIMENGATGREPQRTPARS
jgi:hypothetical protein